MLEPVDFTCSTSTCKLHAEVMATIESSMGGSHLLWLVRGSWATKSTISASGTSEQMRPFPAAPPTKTSWTARKELAWRPSTRLCTSCSALDTKSAPAKCSSTTLHTSAVNSTDARPSAPAPFAAPGCLPAALLHSATCPAPTIEKTSGWRRRNSAGRTPTISPTGWWCLVMNLPHRVGIGTNGALASWMSWRNSSTTDASVIVGATKRWSACSLARDR
mmetsp:Transcript_30519/g.78995  ORF Transcript_30519/g.78995 Transcript_30519/m.78995 type:complete len:219 (-) Transcript_30519:617-1273(-)